MTAVLIVWALATVVFQFALGRDRRADSIKMAWIAAEVLLISTILRIRDNTMSSGVVVYPLLIAAAGLWSRIKLVWWTTTLAAVAYVVLMLDSLARKGISGPDNNESIVVGVLVVTGFVVAKHVNRILAISSYYEHRPNQIASRTRVPDPRPPVGGRENLLGPSDNSTTRCAAGSDRTYAAMIGEVGGSDGPGDGGRTTDPDASP